MVETHAGSGSGTAIMAGDKEFAVAERLHDLDLVLCHRPERIVDVVFAAIVGADAVAVAAQIRRDNMKALGQTVSDLVPGDMGQRVAVQQQQRRAVATVSQMDSGAARGNLCPGEPFEHSTLLAVLQRGNLPQQRGPVWPNPPPAMAALHSDDS